MSFYRSFRPRLAASWAGLLAIAASASLASAQPSPVPADDPLAPTPAPATPFEEPEDEIPQAPTFGEEAPPPPPPAKPVLGYPGRDVDRPVNLPAGVGEVAIELGAIAQPELGAMLRLRYGITTRVQFGLIYGGASAYDKPDIDGGTSFQIEPGKSVGAEFQVLLVDGVAVRATVPMYLDPFAIGMSIGAPLHVKLGKRFALIGMDDVVSFRISKFLPSLRSERINTVLATAVDQNGIVPDGMIRLVPGLIYQVDDKLSVGGTFGLLLFEFGDAPTGVELKGRLLYNLGKRLDVWGSAGFDNLDDAGNSVGVQAGVALRL